LYLLSPRQSDIVALAKSEGRVSVEGLADRFNVTPQTIRKDLNDLCERGVLQRYHGGAILASGTANLGYEARRKLATEEKRRIGIKAASLIPDSSSLLINIGTTTEQVAAALRGKHGLLVITNNMNVANILQGRSRSSSPAASCGTWTGASSARRRSTSFGSSKSTTP
jgi:DeoR family transcriptional regulator, glycerol-3-phosphate regulon repressor